MTTPCLRDTRGDILSFLYRLLVENDFVKDPAGGYEYRRHILSVTELEIAREGKMWKEESLKVIKQEFTFQDCFYKTCDVKLVLIWYNKWVALRLFLTPLLHHFLKEP